MTLNDALEGHSIKTTQLLQKGSLAALIVAASLILLYGRHNGIMVGLVMAICIVVLPAVHLISKRLIARVEQREMELQLGRNTRSYLQSQERVIAVRPNPVPDACSGESDIEILARVIDGQKIPTQELRRYVSSPAAPPAGDPVVFDALPRRYAVRSLYERRFADLAATMPTVACMPLDELLPQVAEEEFGVSTAPLHNLTIEYSNAALDEIRIRAAEGYQRMRHGGVEVGGVLYGTHSGDEVRVLAVRPINCSYSNGPRFVLSAEDETELLKLLADTGSDPALAGMQAVGWYHSHTREEICLSETDVEIYNRFFPQPWQVALVVRPTALKPTRAGFFLRGQSYREFQL